MISPTETTQPEESSFASHVISLNGDDWTLEGWIPFLWRVKSGSELPFVLYPEIPLLPATVPGSVQGNLLRAGRISDWMQGFEYRSSEWIENRHWVYRKTVAIPESYSAKASVSLGGVDHKGWVLWDNQEIGTFDNGHVPCSFPVPPDGMKPGLHQLCVVFDCPPRWMGEFGFTSQIKDLKARFNFSWDWAWRLVQIGFTGDVSLQPADQFSWQSWEIDVRYDAAADLGVVEFAWDDIGEGSWEIELIDGLGALACRVSGEASGEYLQGHLEVRHPKLWEPNGLGSPDLYTLRARRRDPAGALLDSAEKKIGFRSISWRSCEGAPDSADPWICVVNGKPIFLFGVNWTPIRPTTADVRTEQYEERIVAYRDIGVNILRVWGGASREQQVFYDLCDEHGILVWQEMPLSSSTLENYPPDDPATIGRFTQIAEAYITALRHHACLLLWSGGNELQQGLDGSREGFGLPCGLEHPMLAALAMVFGRRDPHRRFTPTSACGPREFASEESEWGKGLHWDVHGPWKMEKGLAEWKAYWDKDDSLLRSEAGCPGASPASLILAYSGGESSYPCDGSTPLWNRPTGHWLEWQRACEELGREPRDLSEYVEWSQSRQAEGLAYAASACLGRFPRCGGFIIWMGHDSYPLTANTSILDYEGQMKPAAVALQKIFSPLRSPASKPPVHP